MFRSNVLAAAVGASLGWLCFAVPMGASAQSASAQSAASSLKSGLLGQPSAPFKPMPVSSDIDAALRIALTKNVPKVEKIDEILTTPFAGLYEVRVGKGLVYTDAQAHYLVNGSLVDVLGNRNLTQDKLDRLNAIDFSALPLEDAIKVVRGNGSRKLVIFADPNCGYCKRLENDLKELKDVTIYTFLFPILGDDSVMKARDVWCSVNRAAAWEDWMLRGKKSQAVSSQNCDVGGVTRSIVLARGLGFTGTPSVVFEDGSRSPGAIPVNEVNRRFAAIAASKGK